MNKIGVHLEHCYGIKHLEQEFDFSDSNTWLIYAPNGVMKTSFAKTFKILSIGKEKPCDQMDDSKVSKYDIFVDGTNAQIDKSIICTIEPYSESAFSSEDKILTLLSDEETRSEYMKVYKDLEGAKKAALSSLKKTTGSSDYEGEITSTFKGDDLRNIYQTLEDILPSIKTSKRKFDFDYHDIFDKKGNVKKFIDTNYELLSSYMEQYDKLLAESSFFSSESGNIFGTNEATSLSDSLSDDAYFHAGHKLSLKATNEIVSGVELQVLIDKEVSAIFNDVDLKKIFDAIDKKLRANAELKKFKKAIEKDPSILVQLADYEQFRKDVWLSYLKQLEAGIEQLVELFIKKKPELEIIIAKAKSGGKILKDVIAEFKRRFTVPFTVDVANVDEAILNQAVPSVVFSFDGKPAERKFLLENVLSQGERRALYLLNVIFDIESRKLSNQETLFVIDDIADSFDYKNKYAIVEYLSDIDSVDIFKSIILTHNFDLFRTIQSRILATEKWNKSLIAEKAPSGIVLHKAGGGGVTDPFNNWKNKMGSEISALIPSIPFVRNIIEFKDSSSSSGYRLLTHALHYKEEDVATGTPATRDITIRDLESVLCSVIASDPFTHSNMDDKIIDVIKSEAAVVRRKNITAVDLSEKLILAIAVRIISEEYMWSKVTNKAPISGSQTGKLYQRYKDEFNDDASHEDAIKNLSEMNIMTPENIHLNSFMYEPILDMGSDNLKTLYDDVVLLGVAK
jgi:hypothetical protein